MVVTLPLPTEVTQYFPESMVSFFQWFGFWSFAVLLTVPWLFCVFQLVTHQLGRTKRIKEVLDEQSAPKVVIVMPCYKEEPEILVTAIDSVVDCDYPPSCIHVFLSFDGDQEDELYLNTIEKLGVPLSLETYPKSIDVTYRTARITVSRFPHGGKRHCQKATFKLIDKVYTEYLKRNDNLFILFIDSDCILDRVCLQNFVYDMELSPGNSRDMLAMTGVITATTRKHSLITLLQDMEYIHGQLFERTVESGCGSVTCLPGALTMLRFSAFRRMAKYYFADKAEQCEDLFDYGKCHLGEDRWLTHLFMIGAKKRFQIQMCTSAFCKTEAVQTYKSLIKQRRRWFLGFITNEVCMLTDVRIWRRYPILALVRFMQNTIRTTALLFFILLLAIVTTLKQVANLPVGFIAISLGLNWLMMIYFGLKLKRFKTWLYPLMFVINPFFNWYYMVYGIFTAGQRTWGGPRADAGSADANTTPQQVIEKAEATGDELNVVPETFKAAADSHTSVHLLPPERLEGRFAAPQRLPGGWYQQENDSTGIVEDAVPTTHPPRPTLHHRESLDSFVSAQSGTASVYMPRRVESIMGEEGRKQYAMAQANQRAAGGAYMTAASQPRHIDEISDADFQKAHWSESTESLGSCHDRPTHQRAMSYNSVTSGESTPEAMPTSPTENTSHGVSNLAIPRPALRRFSSRNGRSPLVRNSLVRTASVDGLSIEMQEQNGASVDDREAWSTRTLPGESPQGRLPSRSSSG
jgi:chitin synthase